MNVLIRFMVLWVVSTLAMADLRLSVDRVSSPEATIHDLKLTWTESQGASEPQSSHHSAIAGQLEITASKAEWSEHDLVLSSVRLACSRLRLDAAAMRCDDGHMHLPLPWLDAPDFNWHARLQIGPEASLNVGLSQIKMAGGKLQAQGAWSQSNDQWHVQSKGNRLSLSRLSSWLPQNNPASGFTLSSGKMTYDADWQGHGIPDINRPDVVGQLLVQISELAGAHRDGLKAAEQLNANLRITKKRSASPYILKLDLSQGGVYIDPWFVDLATQPIRLDAILNLDTPNRVTLSDIRLEQTQIGILQGMVTAGWHDGLKLSEFRLDHASVSLAPFSQTYLAPKLMGTSWEDLDLSGEVVASGHGHGLNWEKLSFHANGHEIDVVDPQGRLAIENMSTLLHWGDGEGFSRIKWAQAHMFNIGMGALDAELVITPDAIQFKPFELAVLDGELQVERMQLTGMRGPSPNWQFDGYLTPISMRQLSSSLGWAPMDGTLSAVIPSITYENGTLELGGTLLARLFEGQILLRHLRAQGLLSEYPLVEADIQMTDLDLGSLTRQFSFGSIEGRLEGRIDGLMLENWQPVAFDAWLGTPDDDRSPHRISQKAIENISDLGGVGVAGALSRGFMRFFDTFRYRRIGIGCTLSNGVCHVHGVTPVGDGYYLVEGGGLPRIDIIGHNRKILWRVFLQRLERVLASSTSATQEER